MIGLQTQLTVFLQLDRSIDRRQVSGTILTLVQVQKFCVLNIILNDILSLDILYEKRSREKGSNPRRRCLTSFWRCALQKKGEWFD